MATLPTALAHPSPAPALLLPSPSSPTAPAHTITHAALHTLTTSLRARLRALPLPAHAAVAIALPNGLAFVAAFLATAAHRAVAAPLNPAYTQPEFAFFLGDLKAALVLVPKGAVQRDEAVVRAALALRVAVAECYWEPPATGSGAGDVVLDLQLPGFLPGMQLGLVAPAAGQSAKPDEAQPDDVALVLHTSGTTGRPKVVPLAHANLAHSARTTARTYALAPADRGLLVMPLFHVHGLMAGLLAPLLAGASAIVPPRFSAHDFWPLFAAHAATWYTAVPTIHQILLRTPDPVPRPAVRFVRSCSSPLAPATLAALERHFGAPVLEAYAMTEAAHQMTANPLPADGARRPGSVGRATGVELRVRDGEGKEVPTGAVGEVCVRGASVTTGYANNAEANRGAFTADGFFRTGDQGRLEGDGYLVLTGRLKEMIKKGGEQIAPVELDHVLARHEAVAEAVCFGIDDEIYGQEVGAAIVLKDGRTVTESELRGWLDGKLVKFKIPKRVCRSPFLRTGADRGSGPFPPKLS